MGCWRCCIWSLLLKTSVHNKHKQNDVHSELGDDLVEMSANGKDEVCFYTSNCFLD